MDLRKELINYFMENGKKETKVTNAFINGKKYTHTINSYNLNNITIEQRYEIDSYAIVLVNSNLTEIYLHDNEKCIAYLDNNLDLQFNQYSRLNEYLICSFNEMYGFLNNFKIKYRMEEKFSENRSCKLKKI